MRSQYRRCRYARIINFFDDLSILVKSHDYDSLTHEYHELFFLYRPSAHTLDLVSDIYADIK
jgi:hypothetical protein